MTASPSPTGPAAAPERRRRRWRTRVAVVVALAGATGLVSLVPGAAPTAAAAGLVPWADCDAMTAHYRAELARTAGPWGLGHGGGISVEESATAAGAAPALAADSSAGSGGTGGAVGSGPTGTNLQEAGVDEPDTAKLAGDLVVALAGGRLQVLRGGAAPVLLSSVPLGADAGEDELLEDGARVLVVARAWRPAPGAPVLPLGSAGFDRPVVDLPLTTSLPHPGQALVRLLLVDVADPAAPRTVETLELDGTYVSARLVDGTVRLVTRSTPDVTGVGPAAPYGVEQERVALEANRRAAQQVTTEQVLPVAVRRGADGEEVSRGPAVDCTSVHAPVDGATGASTLLVTTLRPSDGLAAVDSTAVTTDGDLVHASPDRLHVATSRWGTVGPADATDPASGTVTTQVHAFDTSSPYRTRYVGTGSVGGYLSGRWAMSRHEGHLRVATTTEAPWDGSAPSSSSVVVLAEQGGRLVERGRLDGLGLTERIYAVRWFGDLATVVTFRQTDPLYVLDMTDPARPRLLGELKVPGFSTYLHPVGDDRLLGVGQDADATGRVTGFSLALFDVSDPARPAQVDRLSLGEGWSVAAQDSRAFGYDVGRRLAVLPFESWSPTGGTAAAALGVRVTAEGLVEAGRLPVGPDAGITRVLLAGELAYAVTWRGVVAMDAGTFARTGSAAFAA